MASPTVGTNTGLAPNRGDDLIITDAMLAVTDSDDGDIEQAKITALPTRGILLYNGVPVALNDFIPQTAIAAGALVYRHDGVATTSDSFKVTPASFVAGDEEDVETGAEATVTVTITDNDGWLLLGQVYGEPVTAAGLFRSRQLAEHYEARIEALGLARAEVLMLPAATAASALLVHDDEGYVQAFLQRPSARVDDAELASRVRELLATLTSTGYDNLKAAVKLYGARLERDAKHAITGAVREQYLALKTVYDLGPGIWDRLLDTVKPLLP